MFNVTMWCVRVTFIPSQLSNQSYGVSFNIVDKKKRYLGLHVKFPIFMPNFNQIRDFSTYFNVSPQYQISLKSVQWEPR